MATAKTWAVGRIGCYNQCGEVVVVRQNEAGGLNCGCSICDIEVRHKKGTQSHADCMKAIKPLKAKPEAKPEENTEDKPEAKRKTNFLGIEVAK